MRHTVEFGCDSLLQNLKELASAGRGPREPSGTTCQTLKYQEPDMNSAPLKRTVPITNPIGMHIRPSAAFVELAGRFESTVNVITNDGRTLNGKSLWDLLLLGEAALPGSELVLEAAGPDASQALEALATLLATPPRATTGADEGRFGPGG